jgi:hypothetical protein
MGPCKIVKTNVIRPFCIHHHINMCLDVSISYVRSNINLFFQQQSFLSNQLQQLKKINCQVLTATLSKQKISIIKSNDWKILVTTQKNLIHCPKKFDCSQKKLLSNLRWLDLHHWTNDKKIAITNQHFFMVAQKIWSPN